VICLGWSAWTEEDRMSIILYDFGNSVCCQKVRITLREKGLEWEARRVDLFKAEQYDPSYLKLNPKGLVPTLVHDGHPIGESTLICEYLDETFPDPQLRPKEPAARARMRMWSKFVDEGLFEGITEISFSAMFRERMKSMPEEIRQKRFRNIGDPRRRDRFMSTYELGVQSPYVLHAIGAYERAFALMEQALAEGGPWILGERVTLADVNMMPFVARLAYLELLDVWTNKRPHIDTWWERVQQWPSFKTGLGDLITETEYAEMRLHGPKIREAVAARLASLRRDVMAA
jgi:glutathione S-transferase